MGHASGIERRLRTRRAGRRAALACLFFVAALVAGCLLLFHWTAGIGTDQAGRFYLALGIGAAVVLGVLSPFAFRLALAIDAGPRRARRRVVRAISHGLERDEFELHYQPQVDIATGRPVAVEALLRWRRRDELVPPGEFLADAEASSVIRPLTERVLELAFSQAEDWRLAGSPMRVAVNLSAANLRDSSIVRFLERLLEAHQVPAEEITLEVTETAVLEEPEQTRSVLEELTELGFRISVDDFGTGYSSLLWLRLFPVAEVKIDRTFVSTMLADGEAYVAGVIRLGHDLGLSVIAEGVEDEATLKRLQELGCDLAQGYLFAKPLSPAVIEEWLTDETHTSWAPHRKELSLGADLTQLDEARRLIHESALALGFDETAIWEMKLAATEALTNAIEHGTPGEDECVLLHVAEDNGDLVLQVSGGVHSKPGDGDASHRGRGIAIMTALMDDVELRRNGGDTVIRLAKRRAQVPASR